MALRSQRALIAMVWVAVGAARETHPFFRRLLWKRPVADMTFLFTLLGVNVGDNVNRCKNSLEYMVFSQYPDGFYFIFCHCLGLIRDFANGTDTGSAP